jgi:alpha-L-fucosidase
MDAKLGIFIHWGVYSVPAYSGPEQYAEWFLKGLQLGDTLRTRFMRENYGAGFEYRDFAPLFKAELFQPREWAELFRRAGARYVVLVSKHHDGYALWPSRYSQGWNSVDVGPGRDLVGELTGAVREAGLRMGLYYSLGEWTHPLYRWTTDPPERAKAYVRQHMMPQFKELVSTYRPSLVFSDGDWENSWEDWRSNELVGWYFDRVGPEAVVNDRWGGGSDVGFKTPEYSAGLALGSRPWAEVRGLGRSFGLNRNERLEAYLSPEELIQAFTRAVAAGGGMILNVGPKADGQIPLLQQERLLQLGAWLETNGEAIYGARTWERPSDSREVVLRRIDPNIDFDWVRNGPGRPIREDDFSATWTGVLVPEYSEVYSFEADADDFIRAWVGDDLVVDRGVDQSANPVSSIPLERGAAYPIRVEFQEKDVNARARLFWSSASQAREVIPRENLRTASGAGGEAGLRAVYRSQQEWVVYTRKGDTLYAILFQWPEGEVTLPIPPPAPGATVSLLGGGPELSWRGDSGTTVVDLSPVNVNQILGGRAWTLKIQGYGQNRSLPSLQPDSTPRLQPSTGTGAK